MQIKWDSFDNYLLTLASNQGTCVIRQRTGVSRTEGQVCLKSQNGSPVSYDLVAVAVGVNAAAQKLFEGLGFEFKPPRTTKCLLREHYLGEEVVEKYIGSSMHTFLLNIPHLEFTAIIPKGDYVSLDALALLGDPIDKNLLQTFLNDPTSDDRLDGLQPGLTDDISDDIGQLNIHQMERFLHMLNMDTAIRIKLSQ